MVGKYNLASQGQKSFLRAVMSWFKKQKHPIQKRLRSELELFYIAFF
jgi:hypothetical protein